MLNKCWCAIVWAGTRSNTFGGCTCVITQPIKSVGTLWRCHHFSDELAFLSADTVEPWFDYAPGREKERQLSRFSAKSLAPRALENETQHFGCYVCSAGHCGGGSVDSQTRVFGFFASIGIWPKNDALSGFHKDQRTNHQGGHGGGWCQRRRSHQ